MNRHLPIALLLVLLLSIPGVILTTAQDDNASVPMFRGNPARTGEMPGPGPDGEPQLLWKVQTGSAVTSSPAVVNGVLYIGSKDNYVYAIDAATGSQIWAFQTGDDVDSSPAVVDGVVYAGSDDGNLYAIDAATGGERWYVSTGGSVFSSPVVADGIVYFGSSDGLLRAINASDGAALWQYATTDSITSSPAFAGGTVYVGSHSGMFYALDAATGDERWSQQTSDSIFSSPVVVDDMVYVGSNAGLYGFDANTGSQRWTNEVSGGFGSSATVVDDMLYVGGWDNSVHKFGVEFNSNAVGSVEAAVIGSVEALATSGAVGSVQAAPTGSVIAGAPVGSAAAASVLPDETPEPPESAPWTFETGDGVFSSPAVVDGVVYIGSKDDNLYAIDAANGTQTWSFATGDDVDSSPAVIDGIIYFGSGDGNVYALAVPTAEQLAAIAEAQSAADTATAEAQASATSAAATAEAIANSWSDYSNAIGASLVQLSDSLPGLHFGADGLCAEQYDLQTIVDTHQGLPVREDQRCYYYEAWMTGSSNDDWAWVVITFFDSDDEANAAFQDVSNGLIRSGWQPQDVKDLDHDHACLTLVTTGAQALCGVTRGNAIIVSYSQLTVITPQAALQNAVDLAQLMNEAYDEVDRPE